MKHIYLSIFLILSFLLGGCVSKTVKPVIKKSKEVRHINLKNIHYPNKIGNYELLSREDLKKESLGIVIRYVDKKESKAYLDCYLYPKSAKGTIQQQYKDIMDALSFMHKKGTLTKFEKIYEDTIMIDKEIQAKRALFDMAHKGTKFYSLLYLAPLEDHYFKVRISSPHKSDFLEGDYAIKEVKELYKSIKFSK